MKTLRICTSVLIAIFVIAISGCAQNPDSSAQTTPSPTQSASAQNQEQSSSYLRPRGELKNSIKQGETYNYLLWAINDPSEPFEHETEINKAGWTERKATLESNYGIKINYVMPTVNWW